MVSERRKVAILGATGSIGASTLDVLQAHGGGEAFDVRVVTANGSAEKLAQIAKDFGAQTAVVADEAAYPALKEALWGSDIEAAAGDQAVCDTAADGCDWVMSAIHGVAGLQPSMAAAISGADVALANKETLVCAGDLFLEAMEIGGGTLLPVDSEHNAIFQCFETRRAEAVERIVLTASGGPFRTWPMEHMRQAKLEDALKHPNWSMGAKITIDSASMFNKALELIETVRLFPVDQEQVEVLVHPQSVIHSMVGYHDGSVLAQLGSPDMRTPIAYALGWPERIPTPVERLDFAKLARLDFEEPDIERFPALRLAREVLETGGLAPCALNAAKEVAVDAFIAGRIGFTDIAQVVEAVLDELAPEVAGAFDLEGLKEQDAATRRAATARMERLETPAR